MERPGLLEFAVYALVLVLTASWVYALPPFASGPAGTFQLAETPPAAGRLPASAPASSGNADNAAVRPAVAESRSAQAEDPDREAGLDPRPNLLMVTARSLNMRAEPKADSDLVASYPRGALVEEMDVSGNWVLVRAPDDTTGWMYAGYLGPADN